MLSRRLTGLKRLPFTSAELIREAALRADKMSIAGAQPKLSAILSPSAGTFNIVDTKGRYILKPQHPQYQMVPETEDLTMKLAATANIDVPVHGLLLTKSAELCYFVKRFDRTGKNRKLAQEDFAQLSGATRDTKYDSSLERVAQIVQQRCTVPLPEGEELFRRVLFNFLIGNEDVHLKNYSILTDESGFVRLSPAYDLVSTSIWGFDTEESALPLKGKKSNWSRELLFDYLASERLGLTKAVTDDVATDFERALPEWKNLIQISFLSSQYKESLSNLIAGRVKRLRL